MEAANKSKSTNPSLFHPVPSPSFLSFLSSLSLSPLLTVHGAILGVVGDDIDADSTRVVTLLALHQARPVTAVRTVQLLNLHQAEEGMTWGMNICGYDCSTYCTSAIFYSCPCIVGTVFGSVSFFSPLDPLFGSQE